MTGNSYKFNPFDYCEKLYRKQDGTIVRHNAWGVCNIDELNAWAQEHWDEIDLLPGPTQEQLFSECIEKRKTAYIKESDPLKNEADFDAIITGTAPDYSKWIAKVQEIKDRYPKP